MKRKRTWAGILAICLIFGIVLDNNILMAAPSEEPFGGITHYNAILFDYFEAQRADMEGALAVGGSSKLGTSGQYDIGASAAAGYSYVSIGKYNNPKGYPTVLLNGLPTVGKSGTSNVHAYGGPIVISKRYQQQYESQANKIVGTLKFEEAGKVDNFFSETKAATLQAVNALNHANTDPNSFIDVTEFAANWIPVSPFSGMELANSYFEPNNLDLTNAIVINVESPAKVSITSPRITAANSSKKFSDYDVIVFNFPDAVNVDFFGGSLIADGHSINTSASSHYHPDANARLTLYAEKVIWNFPNAKTIHLETHGVVGSILAPNAKVTTKGGSINGMLIASSLYSLEGFEMHSFKMTDRIFDKDTEEPYSPNDVEFIKVDKNDNTKVLEGAEFQLWDKATNTQVGGNYTTDEHGYFAVDGLANGTYELREITPPNGYEPVGGSGKVLEFTVPGDVQVGIPFVIENAPKTTEISIQKVDSTNTSIFLNGAEFSLYRINNASFSNQSVTLMKRYTSSGTGNIEITDLGIGDYALVETSPPDVSATAPEGYEPMEEYLIIRITDTGGASLQVAYFWYDSTGNSLTPLGSGDMNGNTVLIKNTPVTSADPPKIVVTKVDEEGNLLEGAECQLFKWDDIANDYVKFMNGNTDIFVTNQYGQVVIDFALVEANASTTVPPFELDGHYMIEEITSPPGYQLLDQPYYFEIINGKKIKYSNNLRGALFNLFDTWPEKLAEEIEELEEIIVEEELPEEVEDENEDIQGGDSNREEPEDNRQDEIGDAGREEGASEENSQPQQNGDDGESQEDASDQGSGQDSSDNGSENSDNSLDSGVSDGAGTYPKLSFSESTRSYVVGYLDTDMQDPASNNNDNDATYNQDPEDHSGPKAEDGSTDNDSSPGDGTDTGDIDTSGGQQIESDEDEPDGNTGGFEEEDGRQGTGEDQDEDDIDKEENEEEEEIIKDGDKTLGQAPVGAPQNSPLAPSGFSPYSNNEVKIYYVTVTNKAVEYELNIKKVLDGTDTGLGGVKFKLYKDLGSYMQLIGEFETDDNGYVRLPGSTGIKLTKGSYVLDEIKTLNGYLAIDDPIKFNLPPDSIMWTDTDTGAKLIFMGNTLSITIPNEAVTGSVKVKKVGIDLLGNKDDRIPLAGVEFHLYHLSGLSWKRFDNVVYTTSSPGGSFQIDDLPFGYYMLWEIYNPNADYGSSNSYESLLKFFFRIKAPSGPANPIEIELVNYKEYRNMSLEVTKIDSDSGDWLRGAVFELMIPLANSSGTWDISETENFYNDVWVPYRSGLSTDVNGTLVIDNLEKGKYLIRELRTPDGYMPDNRDDTTQVVFEVNPPSIKILAGDTSGFDITGSTSVSVGNKYNPQFPELKIIKRDRQTGTPLPETEFALYHSINYSGPYYLVDMIFSNRDGELLFNEIQKGFYRLVEETPPPGYDKRDITFEFEVRDVNGSLVVYYNLNGQDILITEDMDLELNIYNDKSGGSGGGGGGGRKPKPKPDPDPEKPDPEEPDPTDPDVIPDPDPDSEKPTTDFPQYPNYKLEKIDDDTYLVLDEDGTPIGYLKIPKEKNIEEVYINIQEELIPLGKINPKTGDWEAILINNISAISFLIAALGIRFLYKILKIKRQNE